MAVFEAVRVAARLLSILIFFRPRFRYHRSELLSIFMIILCMLAARLGNFANHGFAAEAL